jgi:DNA adenine methylase
MAEPVLKWAGGKRQLLPALQARFPEDGYERYHEPFFGGGALFFALGERGGTINDFNPRLVNFYEQIRDQPEALIEKLQSYPAPESEPDVELDYDDTRRNDSATETFYYQQRELFNRRPNDESFEPLEEAAELLYLNRTCFNGLYRENSDGEFNVPSGSYSNPDWVRADQIRQASELLVNTEIWNGDFAYILEEEAAASGDLVYFDPPYQPMSPTANFTDYSQDGFGREDQERLLELAQTLGERGVHVIMSNSGVMYDRYEEAGFHVDIEGATRAINSDASNRDEVEEIIATNIPPARQRGPAQQSLTDF